MNSLPASNLLLLVALLVQVIAISDAASLKGAAFPKVASATAAPLNRRGLKSISGPGYRECVICT